MDGKRALVLGASGQDGPWVAQELHDAGYGVYGTYLTTKPDSDVRTTLRRMVGSDAPASVEAITNLRKVLNARPDSVLRVVPLGRRIDPKSTEVRQT
ncbi:MAG: hypothetical protein ACKOMX_00760, partial [Actinomycetota bacterium]